MIRLFKHTLRLPLLLLVAIVTLVVLRVSILPFSPPGFHIDETASGAHAIALAQHHTDAHGNAWPLFAQSFGGGYTTPVYLYPLAGWGILFGFDELSLRFFSLVITLLAIAILTLAAHIWTHSLTFALATATVALTLPWGWLQGSIAWDPVMVPLFAAASIYGLGLALFSTTLKARIAGYILTPLSLLLMAYAYPPCRVTAPLLFAGYYTLLYYKERISLRAIALSCAVAALASIPLLLFMLHPEALVRSSDLSVFHNGFFQGIAPFITNIFLLTSPAFLFIHGDNNLRHAISSQGMLGIGAAIPLIAAAIHLLRMRIEHIKQHILEQPLFLLGLVMVFGVLASLLGSALTREEAQPHSLRAIASWPFFAVLVTLGWHILVRHYSTKFIKTAVILLAAGTVSYATHLAFLYPHEAAESYDTSAQQRFQRSEWPEGESSLRRTYYETK